MRDDRGAKRLRESTSGTEVGIEIGRRPALILDRDGVVNREIGGVTKPADLELLPGAAAAIRRANESGRWVAVATNQPAIAEGRMGVSQLEAVHERLRELLAAEGAHLDAIAYCPHQSAGEGNGPSAGEDEACGCRKPASGMLQDLATQLPLDPKDCVMVGDSWRDMAAAHDFGAEGVGVLTGRGLSVSPPSELTQLARPDAVVDDLSQAVSLVVDRDPAVGLVADEIERRLISKSDSEAGPSLVLIGGLARAGKSTSTFRLQRALRAIGRTSLILRLDDWLVPASRRCEGAGVRQTFSLSDAAQAIRDLQAGRSVEAPGYDPRTREATPRKIRYSGADADALLVEGVPALLLDADESALRVHVVAPSEVERLARLHRYYAFKGFAADEVDLLLRSREEEHTTVAAAAETASMILEPQKLRGSEF